MLKQNQTAHRKQVKLLVSWPPVLPRPNPSSPSYLLTLQIPIPTRQNPIFFLSSQLTIPQTLLGLPSIPLKERMPIVVQKLFDTCKEVFADCGPGIVPSVGNIQRLRSILDTMKPADVGLTPKMPYFKSVGLTPKMPYFKSVEPRGLPPITYLQLYECPKFSIGIFCLPPSAVIPLHNHPGMTVFSKILFGSMHIKSYDWVDVPENSTDFTKPSELQGRDVRLAKVNTDAVFTAPCETSILYPAAGGNMHCFTAKTACAVLDVLGPPYDDSEKRHCTYYNDFPCTGVSGESASVLGGLHYELHAWLEEKDKKPDGVVVHGAKYRGPRIINH